MEKDGKHLSYRRIAELLVELENTGLVVSETGSKGRYGYGTRYKLTLLPSLVIRLIVSKETWNQMVENKKKHDEFVQSISYKHPSRDNWEDADKIEHDTKWKEYVGL